MLLESRRVDLRLRHAWTIARGSSRVKRNVLVRLTHDGLEGYGEAAPNARYGEDWRGAAAALDRVARDPEALARLAALLAAGPGRWLADRDLLEEIVPGQRAARAALDIALCDLGGRREGVPLWRLLGADPGKAPPTSFSIGLDSIPAMQEKVREAAGFGILKVKVGATNARAIVLGIRAVTDRPLYVDANEAWTDRREAISTARWMAGMGVVLLEQPFPADDLAGARDLLGRAGLLIFADEAVLTADDVPRLAGACDGVNIKIQKAGGLRPALRTIEAARAAGLKVMIGCMIETSIGITAGAHIAPLADHADLDGNLLITGDPFAGVLVEGGRLRLPQGPGLGVEGAW